MSLDDLLPLLKRYGAVWVLYARQWSWQPEDLVQEALVKLMQQSRVPDRPHAWMFRTIRNLGVSHFRREKVHQRALREIRSEAWFEPSESDPMIEAHQATQALQKLPTELRTIIIAHLWGGLTFQEIAELESVSAATAWRRYREGLEHLRQELKLCPIPHEH